MNGKEYADTLRTMADWWDRHPTLPAPSLFPRDVWVEDKGELAEVVRQLPGGTKGGDHYYFWYRVSTIEGHSIDFNVTRTQVCTKRVVGVKEVPEVVIPAHTEEVVEWDCHEPLLAGEEDSK